jgi:hypothetical protein
MPGNEQLLAELEADLLPKLRAIRARKKAAAEAAKPKLETRVSARMAEAVRANPASLRLSAKAVDGTTIIDRPRRTEVIEVLEVDAQGRPSLARRIDCTTGDHSLVEFESGYRRSGVQRDWNPIARLRTSDDD